MATTPGLLSPLLPPHTPSDQSWAGVWVSHLLWASVSESLRQEVGWLLMVLEIRQAGGVGTELSLCCSV